MSKIKIRVRDRLVGGICEHKRGSRFPARQNNVIVMQRETIETATLVVNIDQSAIIPFVIFDFS